MPSCPNCYSEKTVKNFNVMNYGQSTGFDMSQQPENYGTLCPQSIVSVLLPTPTFGQPMGQSSPVPDIVR
jgi:hypothetical protein